MALQTRDTALRDPSQTAELTRIEHERCLEAAARAESELYERAHDGRDCGHIGGLPFLSALKRAASEAYNAARSAILAERDDAPAETTESLLWAEELARQVEESERWEIIEASERESALDQFHVEPEQDGPGEIR